jgi:hypothetical protein
MQVSVTSWRYPSVRPGENARWLNLVSEITVTQMPISKLADSGWRVLDGRLYALYLVYLNVRQVVRNSRVGRVGTGKVNR